MENVYVLVTYLAVLIGLVGCGLMKIGDIFEQKRDRKYYEMIKEDARFWQMKAEQSGMIITDDFVEKFRESDKMEQKNMELEEKIVKLEEELETEKEKNESITLFRMDKEHPEGEFIQSNKFHEALISMKEILDGTLDRIDGIRKNDEEMDEILPF